MWHRLPLAQHRAATVRERTQAEPETWVRSLVNVGRPPWAAAGPLAGFGVAIRKGRTEAGQGASRSLKAAPRFHPSLCAPTGSNLEQVAFLSQVDGEGGAYSALHPAALVDVAAEKVWWRVLFEEGLDGLAAGVAAGAHAIEVRSEGGRVADAHQRF